MFTGSKARWSRALRGSVESLDCAMPQGEVNQAVTVKFATPLSTLVYLAVAVKPSNT